MKVAPVSLNNNNKQPQFGLLKFELDKPSKDLYYNLSKDRPYSNTEYVHEDMVALQIAMNYLTEQAERKTQSFLNCKPETRSLVARDVWPEDKLVTVSVKKINTGDEENLLVTLDGKCPKVATEFFALDKPIDTETFRRLLYRIVRDPLISENFVVSEVEKRPSYLEALEKQARLDSLDPEAKKQELSNDIKEWLA